MPIDPDAIPDLIHWYEGMLLMPQHFQAASHRQEALSGYLAHAAAPHGWGVRKLRVRLEDGMLEVLAVEAVMPDGLLVRYDKDSDSDFDLRLADLKTQFEGRKRQTVHLAVPAWSAHALALDDNETGGLVRYRSVRGARLEPDDVEGEDEPATGRMRERPWLRPAMSLIVTDDALDPPPAKYVSVPLLRLFQDAETTIVPDRYEPPRLEISASRHLADIGREVALELRAKARFLNERMQREPAVPTSDTAGLPAIEMHLRLLMRRLQALQNNAENIQALARPVPRLEALLRDGTSHPFTLYLALCDVAGDLALLGGELNLPEFPAYAHADPLICFDAIQRHIRQMLDTLNQRYRIVPFERASDHRFELRFRPDDLGAGFTIGAVRPRGAPASPVAAWMSKAAIASGDVMPDLRRRRVAGAPRRQIERDDTIDLAAPPLTSLFRIEVSEESIRVEDGLLVIENNAPEGPSDILLFMPRDTDAGDAHGAP